MSSSSFKTIPQPHLIILQQREYLFIMNCILMADYYKFLVVFNELRDIFPKQRKRWVCNNNVGLL